MSSDEIFLYWGSGSPPCWRVMIALEEKGLKYGNKLLSFEKQEHKSDEIVKINPRGQHADFIKLPTLKVGDLVINESLGAVLFLEDKYKSQGTALVPSEEKEKALVLQRAFEATNLQKYVNENIVYYVWHTPKEKVDQAHLDGKKKDLNTELQRWESYLGEQKTTFIAGNEFTLADTVFYPHLAFAVRMGYPIAKLANLKNYYDEVSKRPSVKSTWPPHWLTTTNSTMLADC